MDKKIEELMKDMCTDYPCNRICDQYCGMYDYAERAINAGYRKIPENAVVLTREEYENLQALKDDYVKGYEAGVDEGWDNARKETAEKFASLVEFHSVATIDENGIEQFTISALGLKEILHEEFCIPYDEICKEITGEN